MYGLLTLFQISPGFYVSCITSLLKTLWEKEKLLLTSNFSFPTVFSTPLENFVPFFIKLEIVVSKLF